MTIPQAMLILEIDAKIEELSHIYFEKPTKQLRKRIEQLKQEKIEIPIR